MSRKPLDNPVWHALAGPQADFALNRPHAKRYDPEIAPFFAVEEPSERALRDCGDLLGASPEIWFVRPEAVDAPPGWAKTLARPVTQMILPPTASLKAPIIEPKIIELRAVDAPAMLDLAIRMKPGPFASRTHELGTFLGIHDGDRLVAMAGERMRLPGLVEISAVATEPEYRGRGYAQVLIAALATRIRASGQMPFLHLFADNVNAFALYRKLGFVQRTTLMLTWLAPKVPAV